MNVFSVRMPRCLAAAWLGFVLTLTPGWLHVRGAAADGWVDLFDGRSLTGWSTHVWEDQPVWTVKDGTLVKFVQYADSHLYRQQAGLL